MAVFAVGIVAGLVPNAGLQAAFGAAAHVANPFAGAVGYVNPAWKANVDSTAASTSDGTTAASMRAIDNTPSALWMDSIAALSGGNSGGGTTLAGHLDNALAQGAGYIVVVIYDLPGRDCAALASNGELPPTAQGLSDYKTKYIDPIAATFANTKYANLRIVTIVEPDSLPNVVTNTTANSSTTSTVAAACSASAPYYEQGIAYALDKMHAMSNVYTYVDMAHSGWLGWSSNSGPMATEFSKVAGMTAAGKASIDGFISNTANYTPLHEPYMTATQTVGGQSCPGASTSTTRTSRSGPSRRTCTPSSCPRASRALSGW
ncbi:MAG: cellulose 1,4-beta-cellobiosidase [Gaiellaceae bacterium]|nr:cellulose 1,4-beta-cellobiosidase [Gaiellaceae bacterium]